MGTSAALPSSPCYDRCMPRPAIRPPGLAVLEGVIIEQARNALELRNPRYTDAFRAAISDGLDAALDAARPYLGRRPWWYDLLAGLLSVELAMDQAVLALTLMSTHRGNGREDGRLLRYHEENWIIQMLALIEKSDGLVKRVYRTLVKSLHPDTYNEKLRQNTAGIEELRRKYGRVRRPLVHASGGFVTSVEEDRLWEAHLLVDATADGIMADFTDGLPMMRQRWHRRSRQLTAVVIASLEAAFTRLPRTPRPQTQDRSLLLLCPRPP